MSIRVMTQVWAHSKHKGSALILMLAIADFADEEGVAFPGVLTLAKKCRMSERGTRYLINTLIESGELAVARGGGRGGSNLYRILIERNLPLFDAKTPHGQCSECGYTAYQPGEIDRHHITPRHAGGDDSPSNIRDLCKPCHGLLHSGAILAGAKPAPADDGTQTLQPASVKGAVATAPESSGTVINPSEKGSPRKRSIPDDFALTADLRKWAADHGFADLIDQHFAYFVDWAKADPGKRRYIDWPAAFRNCVRGDWGDIRRQASRGQPLQSTTTAPAPAKPCQFRERPGADICGMTPAAASGIYGGKELCAHHRTKLTAKAAPMPEALRRIAKLPAIQA